MSEEAAAPKRVIWTPLSERIVKKAIALSLLVTWLLPGCSAPSTAETIETTDPPEVKVAATIAFTEGPTVDAQGNVYFTDARNDRIMKWSTNRQLSTFRQPSNRALGLIFDHRWRLVATEASDPQTDQPRVTRTDMETGEIEIIAARFEGKRFHGPNDLSIDSAGRIYFTDRPSPNPAADQTGVNAVYRIDPDGAISRILVEPEIVQPNGIVISHDDRTLYLVEDGAESETGPRMIRAYDLLSDGSVDNMRVFHDFFPGRSGDGMAVDTEGNLYVAAGRNRLRPDLTETLDTKCGIHVFSPNGRLKQFIPIPEDTLTNCAFGGPDLKTLYVTAGKTLFEVRTEIRGTGR